MRQAGLDARVLGFTLLVSVATGVIFGLVPALQASRTDLTGGLKEGSRGATEGPRRSRLRGALVVAEVALSLVLLIGAGLLIRSFVVLIAQTPASTRRASSRSTYPWAASATTRRRSRRPSSRGSPRASAMLGVESAGLVDKPPLGNTIDILTFNIEGRPPFAPGTQPQAHYVIASPGYFETLKIPLRSGRMLDRARRRARAARRARERSARA